MTMFIVQVLGIVQLSMFLDAGLQRLQGSEIISDFYHGFTICVLGLPTFCTGRVLRYTFGVADAGIEKVVGVVRSCAAMTSLEEDKGKLQVLGGALERDCLLNGGLHMKTRHPTSLILCCFFGPE